MHLEPSSAGSTLPEWCARVDCQGNPPQQFNPQDIFKLFQDRVGSVIRVSEAVLDGKKWMKVAFHGEGDLKQVSSLLSGPIHPFLKSRAKHLPKLKREPDTRRNLYVLNLPHDLSVQAYRDLFTPHGTPTHTVLLKTPDSCSRRRGFVVMSTHEQAQDVINWLDGICIRGFQLRVTWANIDRSNGFMSGYDRTTFLGQNGIPLSIPAPPMSNIPTQPKSIGIGMDTNIIVASNIPVALFSENEIDTLFKPFGLIKSVQLIPPNPPSDHPLSTLAPASPLAQTAIVTYGKARDAIAAKNTLHGQVYEGFALAVGFVSKLGQEDHASSLSPLFNAALASSPAPYSGFVDEQFLTPAAPIAQNLRGLPVSADFYDGVRNPCTNDLHLGTYSYGNWTGHPLHILINPHQSRQSFNLPGHYEPDMMTHPVRPYHNYSHFAHYTSAPW